MQSVSGRQLCALVCMFLGLAVFCGTLAAETYEYDFPADLCIWDISGTYDGWDLADGGSVTIVQDAKGKLTGYGNVDDQDGDLHFVEAYTVKGSVTQRGGVTYIKITVKVTGTVSDDYATATIRGTVTSTGYVDPGDQVMRITQKYSMPWQKETYYFDVDLPEEMDGSGNLVVEIVPNGKKVTGTGVLTLSNEHQYQFTVKGALNAKTGMYRLTLSSVEKHSLKLDIDEGTGEFSAISGKVLGQKFQKAIP